MSKYLSHLILLCALAALVGACNAAPTPAPTEPALPTATRLSVTATLPPPTNTPLPPSPTSTPLPPTSTPRPSAIPTMDIDNLSGPYFGQTPPGLAPQLFAPSFISLTYSVDYAASFSLDGHEFYFTRRIGDNQNLYESHLVDGIWSQPAPVLFSAGYEAHEPHVTLDNTVLYFGWFRPVPAGETSDMDYGIWAVDRTADGWSEPHYVGQGMFVSSELSGQLFITHLPTSSPAVALVTLTAGRFTDYERITSGAHPAIAPDGSYLVYDRQGSDHLWVRFRLPDGTWSAAKELTWQGIPLRAQIASISPDGLHLFFTDGNDLYWVSTEIITALR